MKVWVVIRTIREVYEVIADTREEALREYHNENISEPCEVAIVKETCKCVKDGGK